MRGLKLYEVSFGAFSVGPIIRTHGIQKMMRLGSGFEWGWHRFDTPRGTCIDITLWGKNEATATAVAKSRLFEVLNRDDDGDGWFQVIDGIVVRESAKSDG